MEGTRASYTFFCNIGLHRYQAFKPALKVHDVRLRALLALLEPAPRALLKPALTASFLV